MQTRSQTKKLLEQPQEQQYPVQLYTVDIDFDDASAAWRKNKKSIINGCYKYICTVETTRGNICGKVCYGQLSCCWTHRRHTK